MRSEKGLVPGAQGAAGMEESLWDRTASLGEIWQGGGPLKNPLRCQGLSCAVPVLSQGSRPELESMEQPLLRAPAAHSQV